MDGHHRWERSRLAWLELLFVLGLVAVVGLAFGATDRAGPEWDTSACADPPTGDVILRLELAVPGDSSSPLLGFDHVARCSTESFVDDVRSSTRLDDVFVIPAYALALVWATSRLGGFRGWRVSAARREQYLADLAAARSARGWPALDESRREIEARVRRARAEASVLYWHARREPIVASGEISGNRFQRWRTRIRDARARRRQRQASIEGYREAQLAPLPPTPPPSIGGWLRWLGLASLRPFFTEAGLPMLTRTARARTIARIGAWSVLAAVVLDVAENRFLLASASTHAEIGPSPTVTATLTAAAASAKFLALALPVVLVVPYLFLLLAASRRAGTPRDFSSAIHLPCSEAGNEGPHPHAGAGRWVVPTEVVQSPADEFAPPDALEVATGYGNSADPDGDRYGICFSGGGIRSATFALGAMQRLESSDGDWGLGHARYVSAVSGGSYFASAYQFLAQGGRSAPVRLDRLDELDGTSSLARLLDDQIERRVIGRLANFLLNRFRSRVPSDDPLPPTPERPLVPPAGVVEDHLRRNATHLADGASEWLLAIATVVGRAASSLILVLAALWAVATPIGWLQRSVFHGLDGTEPTVDIGGRIAAVPGLMAVATIGLAFLLAAPLDWLRRRSVPAGSVTTVCRDLAKHAGAWLVGLALVLAIAIPVLAANIEAAVDGIGRLLGVKGDATGAPVSASPPVAWAGLTALLSLLGSATARRSLGIGNRPTGDDSNDTTPSAKDRAAKMLGFGGVLEVLAAVVSVVVALIAFSDVVVDAWRRGPRGDLHVIVTQPAIVWWLGALAVLGVAAVVTDVNVWSLRPFYQRRLWLPYAVTPEGRTAPWRTDTRLSELGRRVPGYPELLICAAAQTSGRDWAPPGRRAIPYVFSATACGGPDIGYIDTRTLEATLGRNRRSPITLFGAVATSGAAFGPAMGRMSKGGLGVVLALVNARLGAWLPNPHHLHEVVQASANPDGLRAGSLPRWPRLRYWLAEIVGQYPGDGRLVLTTDGGHVENLGLLELVRRRCDRILCFDASGAGDTPTTLAEAIVLVREELGVEIVLRAEPITRFPPPASTLPLLDLEATGADPLKRPADCDLLDRVAARGVVVATIRYPEVTIGDTTLPECEGVLIYGTLALVDGGPDDWDLLEFAQRHPDFPNDGTLKQWFRSDTFSAYQQLGRRTADRMIEVASTIG